MIILILLVCIIGIMFIKVLYDNYNEYKNKLPEYDDNEPLPMYSENV